MSSKREATKAELDAIKLITSTKGASNEELRQLFLPFVDADVAKDREIRRMVRVITRHLRRSGKLKGFYSVINSENNAVWKIPGNMTNNEFEQVVVRKQNYIAREQQEIERLRADRAQGYLFDDTEMDKDASLRKPA